MLKTGCGPESENAPAYLGIYLFHHPVYTLGPGKRIGLWVRGCSIRCEGCVSRGAWSFEGSEPVEVNELSGKIADIFKRESSYGLSISGGEPFDQPGPLIRLLRNLNSAGVFDILIFTGYRIQEIKARHPEISELAAAVVDGPFEKGNDPEWCWKGSENQTLTLFRNEYAERYSQWAVAKKGRLQVLSDNRGIFVIGIPRQKDVRKIREKSSQ
ncbi:MAG: radical SAM protein [Synergistaceae bacterium]|nr:radical SAM protein [Synergistaceae bacterium]